MMNIEEIDIESTMPKINIIDSKSVNFGPGADLLMNPNKLSQSPKSSRMDPGSCPRAQKGAQRYQNVTKSDPEVRILVPKSH